MTTWPARWDTVTEVRHVNPDGSVIKVTIEQEVTISGEDDTGTIGMARMAARIAAVQAFRHTNLDSFITSKALDGTDPDNRLSIDTHVARRKEPTG